MADRTAPRAHVGPYAAPAANETPRPFTLSEIVAGRWQRRLALLAAVGAFLGGMGSTALVVAKWLGSTNTSPREAIALVEEHAAANTRRLSVIETRVVPIVEASARYTCTKDRQGAEQSGYPCRTLLDGKGILSGTAAATPPDGSSTDLLAVVRLR